MNTELADRVLEYIETHPEEHEQDSWGWRAPCRTTMCFAGLTEMMVRGADNLIWARLGDEEWQLQQVWVGTDRIYVGAAAATDLGLEGWQVQELFYNAKTLEEVKACIELFKAGVTQREFAGLVYEAS